MEKTRKQDCHGTYACYSHGKCRCNECKKANREYYLARVARLGEKWLDDKRRLEREWYKEHIDKRKLKARRSVLKAKYGLTLEDFYSMVEEQRGLCAICQVVPDKPLRIDHNHSNGRIRELLCDKCNLGIGLFKENTETLYRAIDYINHHEGRGVEP